MAGREWIAVLLLAGCHLGIGPRPDDVQCPLVEKAAPARHIAPQCTTLVLHNHTRYRYGDPYAWNYPGNRIQVVRAEDVPADVDPELLCPVDIIESSPPDAVWLGIASWDSDRATGEMKRGTQLIELNPVQLSRSFDWRQTEHIICQEVGHQLGLSHRRNSGRHGHDSDSCMDDCGGRESVEEWRSCLRAADGITPSAEDVADLEEVYEDYSGEPNPGHCPVWESVAFGWGGR